MRENLYNQPAHTFTYSHSIPIFHFVSCSISLKDTRSTLSLSFTHNQVLYPNPVYLSLCIDLCIYFYIFLSISLSLSIYHSPPSIYLSMYLYIYLFIYIYNIYISANTCLSVLYLSLIAFAPTNIVREMIHFNCYCLFV